MHLPTIITKYLPRISLPAIYKPGPVSRPANKQNRPQASLFIIKDDMVKQGQFTKSTCNAHSAFPISQGRCQVLLTHRCGGLTDKVRWNVLKICNYLIWNPFIFIHLFILSSNTNRRFKVSLRTCKNSNLWKTLVVSLTHTTYKHAANGCMLSVIPTQNCQADEKKKKCCVKQLWSVTVVEVNL